MGIMDAKAECRGKENDRSSRERKQQKKPSPSQPRGDRIPICIQRVYEEEGHCAEDHIKQAKSDANTEALVGSPLFKSGGAEEC